MRSVTELHVMVITDTFNRVLRVALDRYSANEASRKSLDGVLGPDRRAGRFSDAQDPGIGNRAGNRIRRRYLPGGPS